MVIAIPNSLLVVFVGATVLSSIVKRGVKRKHIKDINRKYSASSGMEIIYPVDMDVPENEDAYDLTGTY